MPRLYKRLPQPQIPSFKRLPVGLRASEFLFCFYEILCFELKSSKTSQQSQALEVERGHWVWDGLVKILAIDLLSPAWEVRHGAAMTLRELLKAQGQYGGTKGLIPLLFQAYPTAHCATVGASSAENDDCHERWCNALAAKLLCAFILDRFGDFVSSQMVAPVRENCFPDTGVVTFTRATPLGSTRAFGSAADDTPRLHSSYWREGSGGKKRGSGKGLKPADVR